MAYILPLNTWGRMLLLTRRKLPGGNYYVQTELDLRDYLAVVRKRLLLIVSIVVVVTAATGVYSLFFQKPVYEASTKIIVNATDSQTNVQQMDLNQVNTSIQM